MTGVDDLAATQTAPARGSEDAKRWIAVTLLWPSLGVELDRIVVDGFEPGSSVTLYLNTGRKITFTIADMLSRPRFQAALAAALHYGAPLLKQDKLGAVADAILGLASVDEIYSSPQAANGWGTAYVLSAQQIPFDDRPDASRVARFAVVQALRVEGAENTAADVPPPRKILTRESDGALLIVRAWFHHDVTRNLAPGDRGLSPQRIATMMRGEGWRNLAATHSKLAVQEPGTRRTASLNVYLAPAGYGEEATDEHA